MIVQCAPSAPYQRNMAVCQAAPSSRPAHCLVNPSNHGEHSFHSNRMRSQNVAICLERLCVLLSGHRCCSLRWICISIGMHECLNLWTGWVRSFAGQYIYLFIYSGRLVDRMARALFIPEASLVGFALRRLAGLLVCVAQLDWLHNNKTMTKKIKNSVLTSAGVSLKISPHRHTFLDTHLLYSDSLHFFSSC